MAWNVPPQTLPTVPLRWMRRSARESISREARREKVKSRWAQLEAVVGTGKRLSLVAEDLVSHFEHRLSAFEGKAMVVCMSRRICVDLYRELVALRPEWHQDDDDKGALKVVMTGDASDRLDWQQHIRAKARRLRAELLQLYDAAPRTVLFVTHNVTEAAFLADLVIVLSPRPGRVLAEIPVELPRPRDYNGAAVAAVAREIVSHLQLEPQPAVGVSHA